MTHPRQQPTENQCGHDTTRFLPDTATVPGTAGFRPEDDAVWQLAVEHQHPEANRDVVLPATPTQVQQLHEIGDALLGELDPEGRLAVLYDPGPGRG